MKRVHHQPENPPVVWDSEIAWLNVNRGTRTVEVRLVLVGDIRIAPGRTRVSNTPERCIGQPVLATMTPDEADQLADELKAQAALARAGVSPAPAVDVPADIRRRTQWRYGEWDQQVIPPTTKGPSDEALARTRALDELAKRATDSEVEI